MSSTPTGRRSKFYEACTNKAMGYKEHYHPSMHNPNWGPSMEAEFRAQLSEQGFVHEILAEFGTQDTGVFNKDKLDLAMTHELYAYNDLDFYQLDRCERNQLTPNMYNYQPNERAPMNPFRTMGVDWDKYGASSSILILDFDIIRRKFKVIKRIEVPRGEYSYDNAVNKIVELNDQYNPSWIYCDRGSGEYQIERLHIIGDQRPATNLRNKVKGWQFRNTLDITDPITFEQTKEPLKPFMVTQLQIAFDREMIMLSPFDEVLHKQLVDYEVEKISAFGDPVFTKENEHFVDALGLAYLAFVLEFPEITRTIKMPESSNKIEFTGTQLGGAGLTKMFNSLQTNMSSEFKKVLEYDPTELPGDRPTMVKVPLGYRSATSGGSWGSRAAGSKRSSYGGRKMW
jgi:replicative DNA helicase